MSFDALASEIALVDGVAPAVTIAASIRKQSWLRASGAAGRLSYAEGAPPASIETPFDLASVTKPVTALLAARLVRSGAFSWATPLGELLEEARGTASEGVPLELFLAHRAGLEAHLPLFAPLVEGKAVDRRAMLGAAASARRLECGGTPPTCGFSPVYSDLGYLLAGEAMARVSGEPLDALVRKEVLAPLGLEMGSARQLRESEPSFVENVAPTEVIDWRGGLVVGEVHDENAWAFAGNGLCGHAGLFGDAMAVLGLGEAIVDALHGRRPEWLSPEQVAHLVREREGGTLRAGFDGKSAGASSAGTLFGARTFGHLGFTGTSLWVDPDRALVGVLLTNRVHPSREKTAIRKARPKVYDAIARWADGLR